MNVFEKRKKHDAGVVLPSVLALILCGCVIISMFAIHAGRSMLLTRRALQYQRACVLSESGLGFGIMSVRSLISEIGWHKFSERFSVGSIERLDGDKIPAYRISETDNGEYKNGVYFTVVNNNTSSATVDEGHIEVVVYAISQHRESGVASAVKEKITIASSSLGQYAAFYTRDLEVWPGENMTFIGKVHTNGDLYLGADKLLRFDRNVTSHGKFYAMRKPNSGYGDNAYVTATDRVQFRKGDDADYAGNKNTAYVDVIRKNAQGTTRMDTSGLGNAWASESENYYAGAVRTDQMKLAPPISVNDDEHTIIERVKKANDPSYNKDTEAVKFANKAALTIRIDAEGNLHLYSGKYVEGSDANEIPNPERLMQPAASISKPNNSANGNYDVVQNPCTYMEGDGEDAHAVTTDPLPAYQVDNAIYDRRDDKAKAIVDIYVDQILNSQTLKDYLYPIVSTDSGGDSTDDREPGVLYVTRDEPLGYPKITTEQHGTGQYQTTGTDTKTVTSETEKNNLIAQGYTLTGTSTVTKYYYNGREITQQQYNQYMQDARRKRYCSTQTVTSYTLSKPIQTEIMETVAVTNYIPVEPAVRIRNASDLRLAGNDSEGKQRGLSIATDLPLYVEGSFNTNGEKGHKEDNCTDKPDALVAADAVTMLSTNWKDEWRVPKWDGWDGSNPTSLRPTDNLNTRSAVETTFNGVLMTGLVESNGGTYSGGLQNLFRFHENWRPGSSPLPYNFNGSMVCMWTSHIANKPIEGSYTYQPPSRPWGWAQMSPPGLPNLLDIQESDWERIDISQYGDSDFFD